MAADINLLPDEKLLPILDYIHKTYLMDVSEPGGENKARVQELLGKLDELKGKREMTIQFLRSLAPFQRHILEAGKSLYTINNELKTAIIKQDANQMTKLFFRITSMIVSLKLWRHSDFPIKDLEHELTFTAEERAFMDRHLGMDLKLDTSIPAVPDPIVTTREADIDKRELYEKEELKDPDYDEPLRIQLREYIKKQYGIERVHDFSGTKKPLPPGQRIEKVRVKEEVPDMVYYHGITQFLEEKFKQLRTATYRPLDVERKETGGYKDLRIKFKLEGDNLVEVDRGMISAAARYLTPHTIWQKMVEDVKLLDQTLTMGAKKIDKEYYFNLFYHIQRPMGDTGEDVDAEAEAEAEAPPQKYERFEPSKTDDPNKFRFRITPDEAVELIGALARCDQYVFGGHLDLDLYLDGIGIRHKPDVLIIEGEGLGCYDYINNLIILPTLCPPRITILEQIVSILADFRYSLWIDSPKDIFDKQGVGFAIIGRKTKASSKKPLWQIFPTHASTLIKQRAFREYYMRHVLAYLFAEGVRKIAGYELPTTNRIADRKLRQYFDAYVPLAPIQDSGKVTVEKAEGEEGEAPKPQAEAVEIDAPAPEAKKQPAPAAPAAPPAAPATETVPPAAAPAAPAAPPASAAETIPDDHVACSNCGKSIPRSSMFCLFCGAEVKLEKVCKICGTPLPPEARFCNMCGAKS